MTTDEGLNVLRNEVGSWFSLKKPFWQPYWWRLLFRADGEPEFTVMGPGPLSQVPNDALRNASLEVWANALLEDAPDELDDLRGDLLLECHTEPAPAEGTPPVYSRQVRLPGHASVPQEATRLRTTADSARRIHGHTAFGGLPERGEVHFADSGYLARTFKHGWAQFRSRQSARRIPLVRAIGGLLGPCPADGEILRPRLHRSPVLRLLLQPGREVDAFLDCDVEFRVLVETDSAPVVDDHRSDRVQVCLRRRFQGMLKIRFEGLPVTGKAVPGPQSRLNVADGPQRQRRRNGRFLVLCAHDLFLDPLSYGQCPTDPIARIHLPSVRRTSLAVTLHLQEEPDTDPLAVPHLPACTR